MYPGRTSDVPRPRSQAADLRTRQVYSHLRRLRKISASTVTLYPRSAAEARPHPLDVGAQQRLRSSRARMSRCRPVSGPRLSTVRNTGQIRRSGPGRTCGRDPRLGTRPLRCCCAIPASCWLRATLRIMSNQTYLRLLRHAEGPLLVPSPVLGEIGYLAVAGGTTGRGDLPPVVRR
jgi:hypothetical protein